MSADHTSVSASDFDSPPLRRPTAGDSTVDKLTFAPFMLVDSMPASLVLFDFHFDAKAQVFQEQAAQGWRGSGRDWEALARLLIAEQLPEAAGKFSFDSDASLFSVAGEKADVMKLARALKIAFDDEAVLRDMLRRAVLPP